MIGYHAWYSELSVFSPVLLTLLLSILIVNSNAGRNYHKNHGFPEDKMVVIPNGIDTDRFRPDFLSREAVRAEWGIKKGEKLIGLVARLDPMKDHPTFLKAAVMLAGEREDVRFVCVGDGPEAYRLEFQRLSRELGLESKLIWAGGRKDMPGVYNALDIVTSSSISEGFPNVIGEAMAGGIPCVATDVGDSAWIVGDLGVIVKHSIPEDLKNGWMRCFAMNLVSQSEAIRKRVITHFSTENLIQQTLAVLISE